MTVGFFVVNPPVMIVGSFFCNCVLTWENVMLRRTELLNTVVFD